MKVTLWATLSANGNYARATADNPPPVEALQDFQRQAVSHGNFIVGRKTFEGFAAGAPNPAFAGVDIVVLSRRAEAIPGVLQATSPRAALDALLARGHKSALLSGGEQLHNAFLAQGLVDEAIFNVAPVLEGEGSRIHLPAGGHLSVSLAGCKEIGGGLVQLRYAVAQLSS